jgi:hypothetical protein
MIHFRRNSWAPLALCLLSAVVVSGCTSGQSPAPDSRSASPKPSPDVSTDVKGLLDEATEGMQVLGSGYGKLRPAISNTLADTGPNVASVSFVFLCTGNADVKLKLYLAGKPLAQSASTHTCKSGVFQYSVDVPKPSSVSFDADVTSANNGDFAYAYLVEKTQSPAPK